MLPIELLLLSVLFLAWRCFFVLLVVAVSVELDMEPELALALLLVLESLGPAGACAMAGVASARIMAVTNICFMRHSLLLVSGAQPT